MNILTLNAGSNSLKFEIVAAEPGGGFGESLLAGAYDNIGKEHSVFSLLERKSFSYRRDRDPRLRARGSPVIRLD